MFKTIIIMINVLKLETKLRNCVKTEDFSKPLFSFVLPFE